MTTHDQAELGQALFQELGDALFLLDPATDRLIEVNSVALRLTGFSRENILDFPATHLFRFDSSAGLQRLRDAFAKTIDFHGQDGYFLRTREEAWIPVSLTVSRLHVVPKPLGLIIARDERERRQALARTKQVEKELRQVLASSPSALWSAERVAGQEVTTGWQFRYVSPLLARIAGRPPEFFDHPFRWAEVVHPAERENYLAGVRRVLSGRATESETLYRVLSPNGGMRWVRDRLQVVRDPRGQAVRLDGCLTDVTEQWQAEEALQQSEQRFRALVEKSRDGILLTDEQGIIRYASPAARAIIGYEPADLIARDAFQMIVPEDVPDARQKFAQTLRRPGEDVPHTFRAIAADGSVRVIELNGCNRLDDPSVRAVVVNYRDVTERAAAARELARQHALLEGLFASVPDMICYKNLEFRFLGGNPAFEELAGRPIADLLGKKCTEVFAAEWVTRMQATETQVIDQGETVRRKEWVTFPDGRDALLDFAISPLQEEDRKLTGLIIAARDVTEQNRLEEQLRQSYKLEAVGRLAGGIAHDFNNLLTIILGNLELIRSGAAAEDESELLISAERAARQAAGLTKQMLGFARRQPLRTATVNLNTLAVEAMGLLRRTIDPRIRIDLIAAEDLAPVAADPVQVQQVLMNLCLNARDAMPDGGTLTVETANATDARPPDAAAAVALDPSLPFGFVRISVSDTGEGMAEDVRAKIFEPFFTTKEVGRGTGLGLSVVYGAARAHGGWVECFSSPGMGSRFDVYLPQGAAAEERTNGNGDPKRTPNRREGRGETILVADDEPLVRSLARHVLERQGYRVVLAADGAEAVELFRRERAAAGIALVILDASMPQLSGRQAFDVIRAADPGVPVLFASGHPLAEMAAEAGAGFLHKPYTPTSLAAAVQAAINTSAAT